MKWRQILLGLLANLGTISPGMTLGFSAIALPKLMDQSNEFPINDDQASWMASLASISTAIGCLVAGSIMDNFGRRKALLALNVPSLIGWLLIAFATGSSTLAMIYAGRILTGLATGMASAPPTVFCAEISKGRTRGMMITWTSLGISLGILFVYVLGTVIPTNWKLIAGICALFPLTCIILTYFYLPESPSWLMNHGRMEDAHEVSQKLHLTTEKPNLNRDQQPKVNLLRAFFRASTLKPFLLMNIFFIFQQFSGTFVIIFYVIDFVVEAGITFDPYIIAIIIAILRLVVTLFIGYICGRYGRKAPSIVSGAGMTLCMGSLATFTYLGSTGGISPETLENWSMFPVVALLLYILTGTIGFLTIPWAMNGEIYPADVRGFAAGLTSFMAYLYNFIIVKMYPYMVNTLDRYGIFFFYGGVSIIGTIFVVVFLPETKNTTESRENADVEQEQLQKEPSGTKNIYPSS